MTEPIEDAAPTPMPTPILWDTLDAFDYQSQITDLATWIRWLVTTYIVPEGTIPPCWFSHPNLREELTHLWLGWQQAHHPSMGLGRTGMDWDAGREQAFDRLRQMSGNCNTSRGHTPIDTPRLPEWSITLFHEALQQERTTRTGRAVHAARQAAAAEVLQDHVDAVHQHIDEALTAGGDDPANPSPEAVTRAVHAVTDALHDVAAAAGEAADTATDSLIGEDQRILDTQQLTAAETMLAAHISNRNPETPNAQAHWIRTLLRLEDPATTVKRVITKAKRAARAAAKTPPDLNPPD
ncbi:hypothetical protein ABIB25_000970 [Nakamurella sp. UYEF19]|uniref:hypothetical protein n=1 Tax=Nakamurella sp. UYEF19 TaxID=1756392 RepID=UPI0033908759